MAVDVTNSVHDFYNMTHNLYTDISNDLYLEIRQSIFKL